jgi:hypothetical protein
LASVITIRLDENRINLLAALTVELIN